MLNIDELIILYIILNYKINKHVTCVISCYLITNWVLFEFINYDMFIICIVLR